MNPENIFMSKNRIFFILLFLECSVLFLLNSNHIAEQGVYKETYLPLAKEIYFDFHKFGETTSQDAFNSNLHKDAKPYLYPLWGYPILLSLGYVFGNPTAFIIILQLILAMIGAYLFYHVFEIEKKNWHLIFFIPYFADMSVKWPEAVVLFLLFVFLFFFKKHIVYHNFLYLFLSGLFFGITCNFRSDYLWLIPSVIFVLSLFYFLNLNKQKIALKKIAFGLFVIFLITLACLIPWAVRSYHYDGKIRFSSSNIGGLLYISLGQLPGNPWKIQHKDEWASRYVKQHNLENPWSPESDKLLRQKFISSVLEHPFQYALKIGYNFASSLFGGVYVGEYYALFVSQDRLKELLSIKENKGIFEFFLSMKLYEKAVFIIYFFFRFFFMLVFFLIIILPIIYKNSRFLQGNLSGRNRSPHIIKATSSSLSFMKKVLQRLKFNFLDNDINKNFQLVILSFVIYKFFVVSLVQYQQRHMNFAYILLLGIVLSNLNLNDFSIKMKNKSGTEKHLV